MATDKKPTRAEVEAAIKTMIRWAGDDPARDGLKETPSRVARAFQEFFKGYDDDPEAILQKTFEEIEGYAEDSGEGRWTVEEAINHRVPMPVIAASLFARFASRQEDSPTMKAVSALRNQFGGHAVQRISESG